MNSAKVLSDVTFYSELALDELRKSLERWLLAAEKNEKVSVAQLRNMGLSVHRVGTTQGVYLLGAKKTSDAGLAIDTVRAIAEFIMDVIEDETAAIVEGRAAGKKMTYFVTSLGITYLKQGQYISQGTVMVHYIEACSRMGFALPPSISG